MMYSALVEEYKILRGKLSQLSGDEHKEAMMRLIEIDKALKEMESSIPRWSGSSTNYKTFNSPKEPQKYTRKEVIVWTGIGVCFGIMIAALITIIFK